MAREQLRHADSYIAASAMSPMTVVALNPGLANGVVAASAAAHEPFGVTVASAGRGEAVTIYDRGNIVKVKAGASLGHGGNVGLAAATTSLAPVASGQWRVGKAIESAAAGEIFSLYVDPLQLVS